MALCCARKRCVILVWLIFRNIFCSALWEYEHEYRVLNAATVCSIMYVYVYVYYLLCSFCISDDMLCSWLLSVLFHHCQLSDPSFSGGIIKRRFDFLLCRNFRLKQYHARFHLEPVLQNREKTKQMHSPENMHGEKVNMFVSFCCPSCS